MLISPTHATDAARCIVKSLSLTEAATINVRGPDVLSLRAICELLGSALGVTPTFTNSGAAGPAYVADDRRMNALLGPSGAHFAELLHTILT